MAEFARILVPTDFSNSAAAAADVAANLARRLGSKVHVITVVDTRPLTEAYGDDAYRLERMEAIRAGAREQLEGFASHRFPGGVEVTTEVRDGDTFEEILAAAKESHAEMIVLGTRGRGGLVHLLIGSVAEKTVRHSPVPVLTVHSS